MNFNQKIPVFVVSLARASERRKAICQHLQDLNVEYHLIDAVDGATLSHSKIKELVSVNTNIHLGAIGCYLSHIHIYETMKHDDIPIALILEDDARLNPDSIKILNEELHFSNWDYCFLDCDPHNDKGPIFYDIDSGQKIVSNFTAYSLSNGPQTTHAYMITLEAALKRLEHAFPIKKSIDLYDHLPYPIRFYAVVSPKAAWVSLHSLESFTSSNKIAIEDLSFIALRRWPLSYKLRDLILLKTFKKNRLINDLQKSGKLSIDKRWKALPFGREILTK